MAVPSMTDMLAKAVGKTQELLDVLRGGKRLVVLTHTNPDPDSMASALGLQHLAGAAGGIPSIFAYRGDILRAENRAMVRVLELELARARDVALHRGDVLALVDTQPGFGHTVVPEDRAVDIVVDHHVMPFEASSGGASGEAGGNGGPSREPRFRDIRTEAGATSSIVTSYLMEAGLEVPSRVATALFYGIRTDTADLARNVSELDEKAYKFLMPLADRKAIAEITRPSVSVEYFRALRKAMNTTRIYGNVVLCSLGVTDNPEMVAEVADMFLRLEGKQWVVVGGLYEDTYYVSVRTDGNGKEAWLVLRDAMRSEGTYGGHGSVAGGRVRMQDPSPRAVGRLERRLQRSILESLGADKHPPSTLG